MDTAQYQEQARIIMKTLRELIQEVDKECCTLKAAYLCGTEKMEYIKTLPVWKELISDEYRQPLKEHLQTLEGHKLNDSATLFFDELRKIVKSQNN